MIKCLEDFTFDEGYVWIVAAIRIDTEHQIRFRFEKSIKYNGLRDDVKAFSVPVFNEIAYVRGKKVDKDINLFPQYMFIQIKEGSSIWSLLEDDDPFIYRILTYRNFKNRRVLSFVDKKEIDKIIDVLNSLQKFEEGARVVIKSGLYQPFYHEHKLFR